MRDEIVRLKYEPDTVVSVYVPVLVLIELGAFSVYLKVTVRILVKTADNIEKGGLSAAGRTEKGEELSLLYIKADVIKNTLVSETLAYVLEFYDLVVGFHFLGQVSG